ncbi:ATP-binding cassette domain-containing protein [Sneathiella sp. P13V-1]|uniref:peptidase domain-containing ABC transporter n=1 Tax=Sneathiella sp. P13V-1 TaxID=2697366 RepID=UPI00187B8BD5|nr:peptidase domain-containing ABC transporter [Sneathiella sp. P13V-1]MBE7636619.1 ATP-binding cassette domain-containing protein [Sneathiella sp. P13V-1]
MSGQRKWFKSVIGKARPYLFELVTYSLFVNLFALVIPLFVLQTYNRVVAFGNLTTLQGLVIGVCLALVFDFILRQLRSRILQRAAMRVEIDLADQVMKKFWALPLRVLENRASAYWHGIFRDVDTIRNTIAGPPFLLIVDLPFAVLFIILIFLIAKPIAWIFLSIVPLFVLLALVSSIVMRRSTDIEKESQRKRDGLVADMVGSRGTVKALSLDHGMAPYWEDVQSNTIENAMKRGARQDGFMNAGTIMTLATTVVITSFGAIAIINQELSIGALIAANMLSSRVIGPFSQLVGGWRSFSAYRQSKERLVELMSLPEERQDISIKLEKPEGAIKIEDLTFRYREEGEPVLDNVNATFVPNAIHTIMGPNGGGKSTLIKLLKGLYSPHKGRVMLGDADLQQFTRSQLSNWIGYVPQETVLIGGTIRENIARKRDDIPDEEVIRVAKLAGVHNIILDLPDGYATDVGEAGSALSGGVRQRISIARALINDPPVLILDEPSSNLDRPSEQSLRELLSRLSQNHTIVVVSHSPVLLGATDYLHLLDDRRFVLSGPRESVIAEIEKKARQQKESLQRNNQNTEGTAAKQGEGSISS